MLAIHMHLPLEIDNIMKERKYRRYILLIRTLHIRKNHTSGYLDPQNKPRSIYDIHSRFTSSQGSRVRSPGQEISIQPHIRSWKKHLLGRHAVGGMSHATQRVLVDVVLLDAWREAHQNEKQLIFFHIVTELSSRQIRYGAHMHCYSKLLKQKMAG